MHIAEGYLSPQWALTWAAASAPFVVHGGYRLNKFLKEHPEKRLTVAAAGAFTFVMSAIKIPSATGSSSHPTGVGLSTALIGPHLMAVMATITLFFQALLLSHGGITTLGANVFSLGIVGPWVAVAVFLGVRRLGLSPYVAIFAAAMLADLATYVCTTGQLALAHPGESITDSFLSYGALYVPTQLPLAIVEGLVSVAVFRMMAGLHLWSGLGEARTQLTVDVTDTAGQNPLSSHSSDREGKTDA